MGRECRRFPKDVVEPFGLRPALTRSATLTAARQQAFQFHIIAECVRAFLEGNDPHSLWPASHARSLMVGRSTHGGDRRVAV